MSGTVTRVGNFIELTGYIEKRVGLQVVHECKQAIQEGVQQIILRICSAGGMSSSGFQAAQEIGELLRTCAESGRDVQLWTYGVDDVASAAIVLFSAGSRRFLDKNAKVRFHESNLVFRSVEEGISQRELRGALAEASAGTCFCESLKTLAILKEFSTGEVVQNAGFARQMWACGEIVQHLEQGTHCCWATPAIIGFLESFLRSVGENDREYADVIAKRSGLSREFILEFMLAEQAFDSAHAIALGLADELLM